MTPRVWVQAQIDEAEAADRPTAVVRDGGGVVEVLVLAFDYHHAQICLEALRAAGVTKTYLQPVLLTDRDEQHRHEDLVHRRGESTKAELAARKKEGGA